jgi:hypothetical protein
MQDAPVTAYYLWLPFLLTFCFALAKFPRSIWRNCLEGNMIRDILQVQTQGTPSPVEGNTITQLYTI